MATRMTDNRHPSSNALARQRDAMILRLLEHQEVELIVVDIFMPDMDGLEVIQLVRKTRPANKIIAITGRSGEMDHLDIAKHLGAHATLKKPFSLQELLEAVASQLK